MVAHLYDQFFWVAVSLSRRVQDYPVPPAPSLTGSAGVTTGPQSLAYRNRTSLWVW